MTEVQKIYIREDNKLERLIRKPIFWLAFTMLVFSYPIIRSVYRTLPPPLPVHGEVPAFNLKTEFGESLSNKDLKGKVYIASFFFTKCPTDSASRMAQLKKIQKRVRGLGQNIAMLSITVDPKNDTQNVLYKYSRELKTNPHVWKFLTGEEEKIRTLLVDGFKVPMGQYKKLEGVVLDGDVPELYTIDHSDKLVLVDAEGKIRGYYETGKNDINKMMIDVGLLVNREYQEYEI